MNHTLFKYISILSLFFLTALQAATVDRIIAKIGDDIITYSELLKFSQQSIFWKRIEGGTLDKTAEQYLALAFRTLLERRSIDQFIEEQGIELSQVEITQAAQNVAQRNSMELRAFIESVDEAMPQGYQFLREEIKYTILKSKIYNQILKTENVINDEQVNKILEDPQYSPYLFKFEYIVKRKRPILDNAKSIEEKKQQLRKLVEKFKDGQAFEKLAKEQSDAFIHETPWMQATDLPDIFKTRLPKLATNVLALAEEPQRIVLYRLAGIKNKTNQTIKEYKLKVLEFDAGSIIDKKPAAQKAQELYAQIKKNPERINTIIQAWSQNIETAAQKGETQWLSAQALPEVILETVKDAEINEIFPPIQTANTIYVVQLLETRAKDIAIEQQKQQLKNYLEEQFAENIISQWLAKIIDKKVTWVDNTLFSAS